MDTGAEVVSIIGEALTVIIDLGIIEVVLRDDFVDWVWVHIALPVDVCEDEEEFVFMAWFGNRVVDGFNVVEFIIIDGEGIKFCLSENEGVFGESLVFIHAREVNLIEAERSVGLAVEAEGGEVGVRVADNGEDVRWDDGTGALWRGTCEIGDLDGSVLLASLKERAV